MLTTITWENAYYLTSSQIKNLEFYALEVSFLNKMMEDYFGKMLKQEKLPEIRRAMNDLHDLNRKRRSISEAVKNHQKDLVLLREKIFDDSNHWFLEQDEKLDQELTDFYSSYQSAKSEIYTLVEHVLHSQKLNKMILS